MTRSSNRNGRLHPLELLRFLQVSLPLVIDHLGLTLELAELEWQREKRRLLRILLTAVFGIISALFLAAVVTAAVIALTWNTPYRALAIGVFLLLYAAGAVWAFMRMRQLADASDCRFAATRAELARDMALFRDNT